MGKRVLVGLSGGLDSAFTAYLLKQDGYQVDGIHFSNGLVDDQAVTVVEQLASFLGITVQYMNLQTQFTQLLETVDIEICHRRMPNICVMCARDIKFGYVLRYALSHGYDYIATGHYVQIEHQGDRVIVKKARDTTRDQSYGFGVIETQNLQHALTPLGSYLKTEIRTQAIAVGLPFISIESRGLCMTHKPFSQFYAELTKYPIIPGRFLTPDHQTACHQGQQLYTRGQRVTVKGKLYMVDRKLPNGDLLVADRAKLYESHVVIDHINFLVDRETVSLTQIYQILIRYNATCVSCHIVSLKGEQMIVTTETPVFAQTDGQIATLYDGEQVVVGGIIGGGTVGSPIPPSLS